jgi:hypothetical protein
MVLAGIVKDVFIGLIPPILQDLSQRFQTRRREIFLLVSTSLDDPAGVGIYRI